MAGQKEVMTVLGPISPSCVGKTLPHEHLSMTFMCTYHKEPSCLSKKIDFSKLSFNMKDLGWIQRYPYSCKSNLFLNECNQDITDEMAFFKSCGGRTIVENTTEGIDPDLKFLYELSKASGVNIVSGTGYYVACAQSEDKFELSVEAMSKYMKHKLVVGEVVETSDGPRSIKSGCIGEIGCSWPLHEFEKKSLQASAIIQSELDCPVIIHPGRCDKAPFEILRIFLEAGGKANRTVMSHLDRTIHDYELLADFADFGCYNEYDLFGCECSYYTSNTKVSMPNDGERINRIKHLCDEGHEDRILISHDIHTKHRLMSHGGHGFSHIFLNVINEMLDHGVTQGLIEKFIVHNPTEWLSYCCSSSS